MKGGSLRRFGLLCWPLPAPAEKFGLRLELYLHFVFRKKKYAVFSHIYIFGSVVKLVS